MVYVSVKRTPKGAAYVALFAYGKPIASFPAHMSNGALLPLRAYIALCK